MQSKENVDYSFYDKLIVIGDKQVGKSTLIESLYSLDSNEQLNVLPTVNSNLNQYKFSFS